MIPLLSDPLFLSCFQNCSRVSSLQMIHCH